MIEAMAPKGAGRREHVRVGLVESKGLLCNVKAYAALVQANGDVRTCLSGGVFGSLCCAVH